MRIRILARRLCHASSANSRASSMASSHSRVLPQPCAANSYHPASSPSPVCQELGLFRPSPHLQRSSSVLLSSGITSSLYPLSARRYFFSSSKGSKDSGFNFGGKDSDSVPDSPKEDIQAFSKEIAEVANNTFSSLKETTAASITWIQESGDSILPLLKEKYDIIQAYISSENSSELFFTSMGAILAWFVLPRILRRLHQYFEDGSHILLGRSEKVPFEMSFWSAMEDPAKTLVSILAFSQLGLLIAPATFGTLYVQQIWKGAAVFSLVWFLHRWKSNHFSRMISNPDLGSVEKERIYTVDRISSVGLVVLGGMSIAETCGIAVQSVLTVGGVGGVATAFAARDILGNMLTGFSLQFMKPFSIGDIIRAGSVEGQVVNIGLMSTQLLDNDKFPVIVPNSFFSSQIIVNKSRATWRSFVLKIPVQLTDFDKVPKITEDIKNMLSGHTKVIRQSGSPICYASRVSGSSLEINILCNLRFSGKEDLLSSEQDITLESLKIVSAVGATFSNPGFN